MQHTDSLHFFTTHANGLIGADTHTPSALADAEHLSASEGYQHTWHSHEMEGPLAYCDTYGLHRHWCAAERDGACPGHTISQLTIGDRHGNPIAVSPHVIDISETDQRLMNAITIWRLNDA